MSKSILQTSKECYVTKRTDCLEKHHIFGAFNRKHSEEDGLWIWLTHDLHNEPPNGVHYNPKFMLALHQIGQRKYLETHTMDEWMKRYGRNYLDAEAPYIDS